MIGNLILAFGSAGAAFALWSHAGLARGMAGGFAVLCLWQVYCAASANRQATSPVVLRLGGFSWRMEDFCRGWLITGQTGTGKTAGALNAMLWDVSKRCPNWGGVCVDDKGVYWETLARMLRQLGREQDLILLQVRPPDEPSDWKPTHTFNFLDDPHLPYSAKAKIVCDVAASLGQRTEQSFFRTQAQVQMEFAFRALAAAGYEVTLEHAYDLFAEDSMLETVVAGLREKDAPEADALVRHYEQALVKQPAEQLGGVKATLANYLKYFTDPDIAQVFCPLGKGISLDSLDQGKIICLSLPQRFQIERRYINTLLKLAFYSHALRRFDRPAETRRDDNLLIFWADEAQKIVTASVDGMSDYNVVDVIREARATVVAATQSYASLFPPMGDERKAKVFIANMANRVTFRAADEDSAKIAADTLGKRKARRRTYGWSAGKRTNSWTEENRYYLEPHELRRLRKFEAVVQHANDGFRRTMLPPRDTNGKVASWYRS